MKISAGLVCLSLCVLVCLELTAVAGDDDLLSSNDYVGIKDFDTLMEEAGLASDKGRFLLASFGTAGIRAFVDAWNTALAALITSKVPGK